MKYVVAFYEIDRACAGPEEGGWFYDTGDLDRISRACRSKATAYSLASRANRLLDRLQRHKRPIGSIAYTGGRYRACVFAHTAPRSFPETRPTYS